MIKIELLDHRKHVVDSQHFSQRMIRIGRSSGCDFVIPHPEVSRTPAVVELKDDHSVCYTNGDEKIEFNAFREIPFGPYFLRIHNLSIMDDEATLVHAEHKALVQNWLPPSLLFLACNGLYFLDAWMDNEFSRNPSRVFTQYFELVSFFFIASFALSIINRALNGRYQVDKISNIILVTFLSSYAVLNDLLGLRWMLGRIFWINEYYGVFWILSWALMVYWVVRILFDHMRRWLRLIITFIAVLILGLPTWKRMLPYGDSFEYLSVKTPPPLRNWMEQKPITLDEFLIRNFPDSNTQVEARTSKLKNK